MMYYILPSNFDFLHFSNLHRYNRLVFFFFPCVLNLYVRSAYVTNKLFKPIHSVSICTSLYLLQKFIVALKSDLASNITYTRFSTSFQYNLFTSIFLLMSVSSLVSVDVAGDLHSSILNFHRRSIRYND